MFSDPELEIKATSVIDNRINSLCQNCTVKVGKLANMSHHWFRLCFLHVFRDGDLSQSHIISVKDPFRILFIAFVTDGRSNQFSGIVKKGDEQARGNPKQGFLYVLCYF